MENNSSGNIDRTMEVGFNNGPSFRGHTGRPVSAVSEMEASGMSPMGSTSPVSSPSSMSLHHSPHHHHYQQITTITVKTDEKGYGMKVSGDNPVYVQSVKEGGAAERAGLHSGDKIMKVNGVNVAHSTHTEVVELIKSASQVTLTVQQRPHHTNPLSSPTMSSRTFFHSHSTPSRERITGPQPVDLEKKRQLQCERVHTFRLMLEKEQRYVEALRSELARCTDPSSEAKFVQELTGAERRVRTLQEKLFSQTTKAHSHNHGPNHDGEHAQTLPAPSVHSTVAAFLDHCREDPGQIPPPLPQRNRPSGSASGSNGAPPRPPVPPPASLVQSPTHTGLPGLSYLDPPPLPPHPLLHGTPDHGGDGPGSNGHGSQSSVQTHHRAKSSPDPLNNHSSNAEASKRLIVSESLSDLSNSKRSKAGWDLDSPRVTPPGTPPPPYGGGSSSITPGSERTESSSATADITDESALLLDDTLDTSPECQQRSQQPIISMEDDDMSDQEVLEDHGPFKSLAKLWEHNAHLAVFMNYVISNSDPSSLLFYLITDLYKEGNAKEMKKWAYEIHSSFLVPYAPLRLNNVDENVAREIDDNLVKDTDKEEILRRVFWKARSKAKEELNEQLADFQQKRTAGLGTLFGPADAQLDESIHDKGKEMKIVENILIPKIEPYLDDIEKENVDFRRYTTAAALGTVMAKVFGLRGPHSSALLERCPTFVSKEKSIKARFIGKSRKVSVRGHNFNAHQYYSVTYCNHCQNIIWGIGPQGYQCTHCGLNVHRQCVRVVDENCPGPLVKKERGNASISKLMERIREREPKRKPSSLNLKRLQTGHVALLSNPKKNGYASKNRFFSRVSSYRKSFAKRQSEPNEDGLLAVDGDALSGDRPGKLTDKRDRSDPGPSGEDRSRLAEAAGAAGGAGAAASGPTTSASASPSGGGPGAATLGSPSAALSGLGAAAGAAGLAESQGESSPSRMLGKPAKGSGTGTNINRSESYRERVSQKKQLRERRKTSDPNLSKSKHVEDRSGRQSRAPLGPYCPERKSDADLDGQGGHGSHGAPGLAAYQSGSSSNSSLSIRSLEDHNHTGDGSASTSQTASGSAGAGAPPQWGSDAELEPDPPDWTSSVSEEILKSLTSREKKRQEVINELFHTERSHVRNLKVLDLVFRRPLAESGILSTESMGLIFANLDEMLEIHSGFNNSFKIKRKENPVVGEIGDLLLGMFDGPAGDDFQQAASKFCARQQTSLEFLKEKRKKDAKLHSFLCEAEGNPMCRRLQLKDIIPSGMLRLTKYPLLFENLLKYTTCTEDVPSAEYIKVQRALERSKEILNQVNVAVKEEEDLQKLQGIQKRIDRSAFDKLDFSVSQEFRNLDITKHKLVHEGPLNWRIGSRQKFVDLHVLLMEEIIILLQRQDDKFILKFYNVNSGGTSSNERAPTLSPIIKVSTVLVRPNAVDKKALYLVNTSHNGAQIYDLVASSSAERKVWFRRISEAADKHKKTDNRSRRSEVSNNTADDSMDTDKAKVSDDGAAQGCPEDDTSVSDKIASDSSSTSTPVASSNMQAPQSSSTPKTPAGGETMVSPSLQRRSEPLRLTTEENALIEPSEVTISQRPVLTAEPVLTPIERLRRKDEAVRQALLEKQQLVADILHVPHEDFNTIAEIAAQPSHDKEAAEVVLAAINQVNLLSSVLNESLRVSEEDTVVASVGTSPRLDRRSVCIPTVPVDRLIDVSSSISAQLTQLLKMMKERDEERERLRRELQRCREQLHVMHESQRRENRESSSEAGTGQNVELEGIIIGLENLLPKTPQAEETDAESGQIASAPTEEGEIEESTNDDSGAAEVKSGVNEGDPH